MILVTDVYLLHCQLLFRDRLQQDVLKMRKQLNSSDFRYSSLQKTNSKVCIASNTMFNYNLYT